MTITDFCDQTVNVEMSIEEILGLFTDLSNFDLIIDTLNTDNLHCPMSIIQKLRGIRSRLNIIAKRAYNTADKEEEQDDDTSGT